MKLEDAEADARDATVITPKRRRKGCAKTKSGINRKTATVSVPAKIRQMARDLGAYVKSGFNAAYAKTFELGRNVIKVTKRKLGPIVNLYHKNAQFFKQDSGKAIYYVVQAGKFLIVASAAVTIVATTWGAVLAVLTTPVVIAAGGIIAAGKFLGGEPLMSGIRSFMGWFSGPAVQPALRAVV